MKNLISLDSLTDIVSNSVGILIIFAVINLIHDNNKTYQLEIPIEHRTELRPAFFMIKNNRILALDTYTLFSNATLQATSGAATNERFFSLDYFDLLGKIDTSKGMSFYARDTSKWPTFQELDRNNSTLSQAFSKLNPAKQFAFFFVYDSNDDEGVATNYFEAFRKAREYLKAKRIKTGWQPVNDESPANICNDRYGKRCSYLPSYLGNN